MLRLIRERFAARAAAQGHPHLGLPPRDHRDRQPRDHAQGGRRRPRPLRQQPALDAGRRGGLADRATTASPIYAIKGEDEQTYYRHIHAALDHAPQMTMDDGCDLVSRAAQRAHRPDPQRHRRDRGDDDRRHSPAQHAAERRAALPRAGGQRLRHQASLRQPLRHRPEHDRRHHPRDQPADRRAQRRRGGLRLVRQGRRLARAAAWAPTSSSPRSIPCAPSRR